MRRFIMRSCTAVLTLTACLLVPAVASAAELEVQWPLKRTAYQTNEQIDLAVVRSAEDALKANPLTLTLSGEDGSRMTFHFTAPAAAVADGSARRTEHLHLNGRLLRPGKYTVEVAVDGAKADAEFELFGHVRKSSFKLVNWGRAKGETQLSQGEDNLGFNLFYGHYGQDEDANFIRAGVDFMANCVMSGGHQMDLRMECDWSDPYVIRGGTRRVAQRAFIDRTRPNVPGVHFYDEPGLTWHKHPETGEFTPHGIPAQVRAYKAAFGKEPPQYHQIDPNNPDDVARWKHWATWKLGFMDAAWRDAQFGVSYVRPDFLSVTQSQYGFSAFTDGYYFNVVRSLPVVSGHGGYHDWGPGYFNPSMTLEFARARDFDKPCWYLPTWYGNTTTDLFRLEQYLSFQTNLQGMVSPPDIDPFEPDKKPAAQGVVESNRLMGRLGTIFTTMPVTRPPVALLSSLSNNIHLQTQDRSYNYSHAGGHGANIYFTYLAGKLLQHQFLTVLDEDVIDGTLAANHKAIILTSLEHLDPEVVAALEAFAEQGGLVLVTGDCRVKVNGAVDLGVTPVFPDAEKIEQLRKAGENQDAGKLMQLRHYLVGAQPLADAIRPHLEKAGIRPMFECDQPGITATRQAAGDIEYLFAVNATHDFESDSPLLGLKAVAATLGLKTDGRPVYDAVLGGPAAGFNRHGDSVQGTFRFGPGQMRVFALTARPIGSVRAATPIVRRSYTETDNPLRVDLAATLLDEQGGILSGSAPLHIRLIDPLGVVRYELFRATDRGTLQVSLPLAINDPAGEWKVEVRDLLANSGDTVSFRHNAVPSCAHLAGATRRAVVFGNDRDNVHRFARVNQTVTVVKGTGEANAAAAERLGEILKPWDIDCRIVEAAEVNKSRTLTEEEARTWIGLQYAGSGQIKPGDGNPPIQAGFAVRGPVILVGSPDDNPLIDFLAKNRFLPYAPAKDAFPGRNRGMVAWQRDGIGAGQESVTLIGYDAQGLSEAVGTFYEAVAGLDPLTPLALPQKNSVSVATRASVVPEATVAWQVSLPDRVVALQAADGGWSVLTHDGSLTRLNSDGQPAGQNVLEGPAYAQRAEQLKPTVDRAAVEAVQKQVGPSRLVKFAVPHAEGTAVAYWGGRLELRNGQGEVLRANTLPQDVTALASTGDKLVVGLADGRVLGLDQ